MFLTLSCMNLKLQSGFLCVFIAPTEDLHIIFKYSDVHYTIPFYGSYPLCMKGLNPHHASNAIVIKVLLDRTWQRRKNRTTEASKNKLSSEGFVGLGHVVYKLPFVPLQIFLRAIKRSRTKGSRATRLTQSRMKASATCPFSPRLVAGIIWVEALSPWNSMGPKPMMQ